MIDRRIDLGVSCMALGNERTGLNQPVIEQIGTGNASPVASVAAHTAVFVIEGGCKIVREIMPDRVIIRDRNPSSTDRYGLFRLERSVPQVGAILEERPFIRNPDEIRAVATHQRDLAFEPEELYSLLMLVSARHERDLAIGQFADRLDRKALSKLCRQLGDRCLKPTLHGILPPVWSLRRRDGDTRC